MPTAIWTGSLSFGLVVIPVRLYAAVRRKAVRFHELDRSGRRIRHVRVAEAAPEPEWSEPEHPGPAFANRGDGPERSGEPAPDAAEEPGRLRPEAPARSGPSPQPEVEYREIRKGFEVAPGQYVSLTREEVAALAPERSRSIDVEQFVGTNEVDPIYFESRYYLVPDREAIRSFRLLHDAMREADRMAIAWITLRARRHLSAIRAHGDVMLLTTMVHADEVLPADFWLPAADAKPTERETKMARMLIDALTSPFEPARFTDEHRSRVLKAIAERAPAEQPMAASSPTKVLDLMAALEASVKAAKAAKAETEGAGKRKPARRRARGA